MRSFECETDHFLKLSKMDWGKMEKEEEGKSEMSETRMTSGRYKFFIKNN